MDALGGSSSHTGKEQDIDLEEMMKSMELMEEELYEVVIGEKDVEIFAAEARVIIEDYDNKTDPDAVILDGLYVWAQIHKIPDLYRRETVVDQLAHRIGKVREVQMHPTLYYEGDSVRVHAKVITANPLTRFIPLIVVGEGTQMLVFKYEKIR
ncbi:hypothetical protein D1007_08841 [Hordeum vulgare]|nr:hypothetical protein D1007_08841 [Hordeum vulgare]